MNPLVIKEEASERILQFNNQHSQGQNRANNEPNLSRISYKLLFSLIYENKSDKFSEFIM
jgi:hypothetical protein